MSETIAALLKSIGIRRIAYFDGCDCGHFALQNLKFDLGCRRGNGYPDFYGLGIKIEDHNAEYDSVDLITAAFEIFNQMPNSNSARVCITSPEAVHVFDLTRTDDGVLMENRLLQSNGDTK